MKKLLLLLAAGSFAVTAGAQQRVSSVVFNNGLEKQVENSATAKTAVSTKKLQNNSGNVHSNATASKTTVGGGRWYDYVGYQSTVVLGDATAIGSTAPYLWNDTSGLWAYSNASGGTDYAANNLVSIGMSFDPVVPNWNNTTDYSGMIEIKATNAYTVDSIAIAGIYSRNPSKASVVDTLRFSMVYGDGSSTSNIYSYYFAGTTAANYGTDTLTFITMGHDTVANIAKRNGTAPAALVFDVLLNTAAEGDTLSNGLYYKTVAVPGGLSVPAGNFVSTSITYKSGDATYVPGDTIFLSGGNAKYNYFRPMLYYNNSGGSTTYHSYNINDQNIGYFQQPPYGSWSGDYIPSYAYSTSSGASTYQWVGLEYHATCATCFNVGIADVANQIAGVKAYPSPANNELNISFELSAKANVNVVLTNTLGQVVAKKQVNSGTAGVAAFNTSNLADGVYFYSVEANGQRTNGKVLIAH